VAVAVPMLARQLGRDPADALVLALGNPLTLLHLVSGAHNEALMVGLLTAGIVVGRRPGSRALAGGLLLVGLAAAVKAPAIVGAAYLGWIAVGGSGTSARRWFARVLGGGLAALVSGVVVLAASLASGLGVGWLGALGTAGQVDAYLSVTSLAGRGLAALTSSSTGSVATMRLASAVAAATAATVLVTRSHRLGVRAPALALLALAVLGPAVQPWYLTWGLVLMAAAVAGDACRLLVGVSAVLVFLTLPGGPLLGQHLATTPLPTIVLNGVCLVPLAFWPRFSQPEGSPAPTRLDSPEVSVA
jgi:alpha-1,6-mannosyltransferase